MLIYTYDNTLEGLLTCVFESYARKEQPDNIAHTSGLQYQLDQELVPIETDEASWQRVRKGIMSKFGSLTWKKILACYCASIPDKEMILYHYLKLGFDQGRATLDNLAHPDILALENLYKSVGMEQQRMIMFVRFSKIPEGVYCSTINPKHSVLPLIMDHFAARFNVQPFVIFDENHQLAGISQNGEWYLSEAEGLSFPEADTDDLEYQRLWKSFYDAIAIPERRNEKVRMQFMPKRLWKNLPEMQPRP